MEQYHLACSICSKVRSSVVKHDLGTELHSSVRCVTVCIRAERVDVRCGADSMVQKNAVQYNAGTVWSGAVQYDLARSIAVSYDSVRFMAMRCTVQCNMLWG